MKLFLKILKKTLMWGGILLLVIMIGAFIAIKIVVTKDFVATQVENNINGRVEIKDITVPIWAAFSGITIDEFKIGYRDAEVLKKMADRTPMKNHVIALKQFNFKVAIGRLIVSLGKDFELKSLLLVQPEAHIVLLKAGGNNLQPLLTKPKSKEDLQKEAEEAKLKKEEEKKKPVAKKVEPPKKAEPKKPFDFRELSTVIKMGKIGMEQGLFTINMQATGQTLKVSGVNVLLHDILIDPKDLDHKDHVELQTGFTLELVESKTKGVKSFKIIYDLSGHIVPINPKTGGPAESVTIRMGLRKGTFFTGLAIFDKLKNQTENLQKAKINLNFLGETQTLSQDAFATIYYNAGVITLLEPPALITSDFSFRMTKDDFINVKTMDHHFRGDLALAQKHTKTIEDSLDKVIGQAVNPALEQVPAGAIRDQLKNSLAPAKIRAGLLAPAMQDGLITFGLDTSKKVTSPVVKVTKPQFPDIKAMIASEIQKALSDVKGLALAELNKLKDKLMGEANKQIDAAKGQVEGAKTKAMGEANKQVDNAKAQADAKAKAAQDQANAQAAAAQRQAEQRAQDEAAKNVPKIPGF